MFPNRLNAATTLASTLATAIAAIAAAVLMPLSARAETCAPIEVQNLHVGQGMLMLAAYDSAEGFNKTPVARMRVPADTETVRFTLCVPGSNVVSLTMYQDVNGNGKLDASVLGIPSEPFGASGSPSPFGPPTWATTQVTLDAAATAPVVVKLSK